VSTRFDRGKQARSVDKEGRAPIPKSMRADLGKKVVLAPDMVNENFLNLFRQDEFEDWLDSFANAGEGLNDLYEDEYDLDTWYAENAATLEVDSANRIAIPEELRERVGLGKEIYFMGRKGKIIISDKLYIDNRKYTAPPKMVLNKRTRTDSNESV
jgi:DNA-binding transcriptional regulator/RsmH inhibitor MraZ